MSTNKRLLYLSNSYPLTTSGVSTVTGNLLHWMSDYFTTAIICPNTSPHYSKDRSLPSVHYRLPSYGTPVRKDFRFITPNPFQLEKVLLDFQPNLVHFHDPTPASIVLKDLCLSANIPVIFSHHFTPNLILGYLPEFLKLPAQNNPALQKTILQLTAKLYEHALHIIVPTLTIQKSLAKYTDIPISIISSGVNYQALTHPTTSAIKQFATAHRLPTSPFAFFVGRLDPDKNLDILIKAWSFVHSSSPSLKLVLVGTGSQLNKLKTLASSLKISSSLIWTGHISQSDLPHLYNNPLAQVFVIPSPVESQSIVSLMALAAGKPVVAANAGALPEIIIPGVTGFLFPPQNPRLFAQKILTLLKLSPSAFSAAAHKLARRHAYPLVINQYLHLYRNLLK